MTHLSKEEIEELARRFATLGKRDTEFEETSSVDSSDIVAIVKGDKNKKITISNFFSELPNIFNLSGYVDGRISSAMSAGGIIGSVLAEYVKSSGGTFSGVINFEGRTDFFADIYSHYNIVFDSGQMIEMDEGRITGLLSPVSNTEATNKSYVDSQIEETSNNILSSVGLLYLKKDGSVAMTGALNMGNKRIENLAPPLAPTQAATKGYADDILIDAKSYADGGLATKQNILVSGTNIKTINNQSLLGGGNIIIDGSVFTAYYDETEYQVILDAYNENNTIICKKREDTGIYVLTAYDAEEERFTFYSYAPNENTVNIITISLESGWSEEQTELQDALVSGQSIKTINGESVLGAGNIVIEPGSEPDNEDIAIDSNNRLKFADRAVAANQKGYVILRKNKTLAEQVTDANTIYEIRYDFDLGGASVTIPSGCVLRFVGGSISNGTITTNPFRVVADNDVSILKGISFDGPYITNDTIFVDWFDFVTDGITDNLASFKRLEVLVNTKGGGNIVFGLNKTYGVLPLVVHRTNVNFSPVHYGLWFEHCNNLDVNLNGSTIKVLGTNTALFGIVNFFDCEAKIHNGILRGDRDVHDYTPYINYAGNSSDNFELIHNLNQMGGDLEIYDLVSEYVCGDGFLVGSATVWSSGTQYEGTYNIHDCEVRYCGRNGITLHSANGVPTVKDTVIHHIGDYDDMPAWSPKAGIDIEFEDGVGALGDLRLTNLVITDCTNRTISTFTNTQVNTFVAENVYSEGLFQVSNIKGKMSNVVNSVLRETKSTSYFIGGTTFIGCQIVFTTTGHLLYNTKYYDCSITSEFETDPSEFVIVDGEGDAEFHNCKIALHRTSLRYFTFHQCNITMLSSNSYSFKGVNCYDSTISGVIDANNKTGSIYAGNSISGRVNKALFKNCLFANLKQTPAGTKGINLDNTMDGTQFIDCGFNNVNVLKGPCQMNFLRCNFTTFQFINTTISKVLNLKQCIGDLVLGNGNASYRDQIDSCDLTFNIGGFQPFNSYQHFDVANSILKDGGGTGTSNSAVDVHAKNTIFVFNKNYTSTNMVMEGCNITGITEAQFKGTKKNCVFAVPFATSGATADRPTASAVGAGFTYFDTDLGKMIVSNGTDWVNMDGSAL